MKTTVTACKVRGKKFWRVRWRVLGQVKRKFFTAKNVADAHAAKINGDQLDVNQFWTALPRLEREQLYLAWKDAQSRGIDIRAVVASSNVEEIQTSKKLPAAQDEFLEVKEKSGVSESYLASIRQILKKFICGRESLPVNKIGVQEIEAFLESKNLRSRPTLRTRLSSFFRFSVRRGYCHSNPCDRLEPIRVPSSPRIIFTPEQIHNALTWLKENPRALAWFILTTFAGLRPEEAQQTTWPMLNFTENWVRVEEQTSKVRERRVVYPREGVMKMLRAAKKKKSELPLTTKQLQIERKMLRAQLGFEKWPHDITRHTAASMWLAISGDSTEVAHQLGHGERILHRNYKALVTKADAEKFWAVRL